MRFARDRGLQELAENSRFASLAKRDSPEKVTVSYPQLLVNGITGEVGTSLYMSGDPRESGPD
jgi:hypothetical protein